MIELDGIEYSVQTPREIALEVIEFLNTYCAVNNIRNSHGDIISFQVNSSSLKYLIIFGFSYIVSILQKLLYSVGCSNSIPFSSDRQLLALMERSGLERKQPTATTILATINADSTGPCSITTTLTVSLAIGGQPSIFHPAYDLTIPAGDSAVMTLVCEELGPTEVDIAQITSFDTNPANFLSMIAGNYTTGRALETISAARMRLQEGGAAGSDIDQCIAALSALPGVSEANVYFNYSTVTADNIDGVIVEPRHSAVYILGYSSLIAETYMEHMTALTSSGTGSQVQNYVTKSGQSVPVYFLPPQYVRVYIRVYERGGVSQAVISQMQSVVLGILANKGIGDYLHSAEVIELLENSTIPNIITGCTMSSDGISWGHKIDIGSNQVIQIDRDDISIVAE